MAQFVVDGMDELMLSMQEIEELPESLVDEILNAQADVLTDELQERCRSYGASPRGTLTKSIKKGKPKRAKNGCRQIIVAPRGTRRYVTKKGDVRKRTNATIAFMRNYGARRVKALPFWSDGVLMADKTMQVAATDIHHRWLESKGL